MKVAAIALVALLAAPLAGCTVSQEVRRQCLGFGFKEGTEAFAQCQLDLTKSAMAGRAGGGGVMAPQVQFQPLQMPTRQTVRVQANCTSYQMGGYTNTDCY